MKNVAVSTAILASLLLSGTTLARPVDPLPGSATHVGPYLPAYKAPPTVGGTWSTLTNAFPAGSPDTALLLTDGSVMMHVICSRSWYRLKPDATGNYKNGTWTATALMPAGYSPIYFASQILPDGRVIINGGEYNGAASCDPFTGFGVWTNQGALYNPVANKWVRVAPPTGWANIGDAQSVVRADGKYMIADPFNSDLAIATISGTTVTWAIKTSATTGKADRYDEEGWSHLPNRKIMTVDATINTSGSSSSSELFNIVSNLWTAAANTVGQLVDFPSSEIGPGVLLPTGLFFQFGGTSNTGIYKYATNAWISGPVMPGGNTSADGPAAVMPNGKILVQVSPGVFHSPSSFYEVTVSATGATMAQVSAPSSAPFIASFEGRMLVLPTGQILWSSDSGDVEIYTPTGVPRSVWLPVISNAPAAVTRGIANYLLQGTLLHGLSEGGYYGDDAQMSSNYPLIRLTNNSTYHVCYARTYNFSRMGVADRATNAARFSVPATCEAGASTLQVVVNGIASAAQAVTVN